MKCRTYDQIKTFADKHGNRGVIGDRVQIFDPYQKNMINVFGTVLSGHKQGTDGTILRLDVPPLPDYPNMFTHRASEVVIVKGGENP